MKDYFNDLDKWELSFSCNECGSYEKNDFSYERTIANGEVWHCKHCHNEILVNQEPNQDDY